MVLLQHRDCLVPALAGEVGVKRGAIDTVGMDCTGRGELGALLSCGAELL
jgi:hypothetical protein